MEAEQIAQLINTALQDTQATVTGQSGKFEALVVSQVFAGLSTLERHRKVYAAVSEQLADGRIHALSIKAYTPEEYSEQVQS